MSFLSKFKLKLSDLALCLHRATNAMLKLKFSVYLKKVWQCLILMLMNLMLMIFTAILCYLSSSEWKAWKIKTQTIEKFSYDYGKLRTNVERYCFPEFEPWFSRRGNDFSVCLFVFFLRRTVKKAKGKPKFCGWYRAQGLWRKEMLSVKWDLQHLRGQRWWVGMAKSHRLAYPHQDKYCW